MCEEWNERFFFFRTVNRSYILWTITVRLGHLSMIKKNFRFILFHANQTRKKVYHIFKHRILSWEIRIFKTNRDSLILKNRTPNWNFILGCMAFCNALWPLFNKFHSTISSCFNNKLCLSMLTRHRNLLLTCPKKESVIRKLYYDSKLHWPVIELLRHLSHSDIEIEIIYNTMLDDCFHMIIG